MSLYTSGKHFYNNTAQGNFTRREMDAIRGVLVELKEKEKERLAEVPQHILKNEILVYLHDSPFIQSQ